MAPWKVYISSKRHALSAVQSVQIGWQLNHKLDKMIARGAETPRAICAIARWHCNPGSEGYICLQVYHIR